MEIISPLRKKNTRSTMMPTIPDDIIHYNILTRLPELSLLRFKCVSKNWYILITSSTFIKIHQKYVLGYFIVDVEFVDGVRTIHGYSRWIYTYIDAYNSKRGRDFEIKYNQSDYPVDPVGSSNGLFCCLADEGRGFMLCNPLTRECSKIISYPQYDYEGRVTFNHGFGYDFVSCDFKILEIRVFYATSSLKEVSQIFAQVYSANNNSWKVIEKVPQLLCVRYKGEALNNKLHWIDFESWSNETYKILTVDLCTEEFGEMSISTEMRGRFHQVELMVLSGLLYVTKCTRESGYRKSLWVMKEYGVQESWTKLCELPEILYTRPLMINTFGSRRKSGELLIGKSSKEKRELVWYNIEDDLCENFYHPERNFKIPWVCIASQVPIPDKIRVFRKRNVMHSGKAKILA